MEYTVAEIGILALLGYVAVFVGIAFLTIVIVLLGKIMAPKKQAAPAAAPVAAPAAPAPTAPGVAGQLKLHDVEPKTAAMVMAIVADKMGKPLNELRFISIKEVK